MDTTERDEAAGCGSCDSCGATLGIGDGESLCCACVDAKDQRGHLECIASTLRAAGIPCVVESNFVTAYDAPRRVKAALYAKEMDELTIVRPWSGWNVDGARVEVA